MRNWRLFSVTWALDTSRHIGGLLSAEDGKRTYARHECIVTPRRWEHDSRTLDEHLINGKLYSLLIPLRNYPVDSQTMPCHLRVVGAESSSASGANRNASPPTPPASTPGRRCYNGKHSLRSSSFLKKKTRTADSVQGRCKAPANLNRSTVTRDRSTALYIATAMAPESRIESGPRLYLLPPFAGTSYMHYKQLSSSVLH